MRHFPHCFEVSSLCRDHTSRKCSSGRRSGHLKVFKQWMNAASAYTERFSCFRERGRLAASRPQFSASRRKLSHVEPAHNSVRSPALQTRRRDADGSDRDGSRSSFSTESFSLAQAPPAGNCDAPQSAQSLKEVLTFEALSDNHRRTGPKKFCACSEVFFRGGLS